MIPIGTLCIAKIITKNLLGYNSEWWNINVAGKIVKVVSHSTPATYRRIGSDHEIECDGNRYIACSEGNLVPVSNPGLTDEIIKETLAPHLRPIYDILVNIK